MKSREIEEKLKRLEQLQKEIEGTDVEVMETMKGAIIGYMIANNLTSFKIDEIEISLAD